ncbi:hypothetical protein SUGI_0842910 [Cryptomeria japonica]|uniref:hydroxycinnamoyltransferase n=1 Tax=Cryptomeria japonica TaxID=3369 RepID=UPI002414809A|nr:hydroxycinnamoyltransferase [Cryptomeria japonica]GLJ40767.1 hypothetical protein SUGI_0842910 [Cryptomeria japonica]
MAEAETEVILKMRKICVINPAIPSPIQTMFLSNLDLYWIPFDNVQNFFFYRCSPSIQFHPLIQGLKRSLSSVLVHFYPLAGRLKKGESGRMEVDCTNGGVQFMEASISVPFQDLEKNGFRYKPYFQKLVPNVNLFADENHSTPLLSIQVTAFEGAGLCIAIKLQHVIVDGASFYHFMTSWAECSRGIPISKPPQHNRTAFKQEYKKSPSISYRAHDIKSLGITGAQIFKFVPENSRPEHQKRSLFEEKHKETPQNRSDLIYATFCFTEETIQELKQRSGASSSFVAVAAQFWRCIMRARQIPEEESVYFLVLPDCRNRVKPPLLPTYFGNCLSVGVAKITAGFLINAHISFAADVIQQLINSCTEEAQINHLIDWVEVCNRRLLTESGLVYGTKAVNSPRFPMYDIDYGWGKPVDSQMPDMNDIGSMVLLPPKDGSKSIMISTCLPPDQMEILDHLLCLGRVYPSARL